MPRENSALKKSDDKLFVNDLGTIVSTARDMSFRAANLMQVACNWLIGWRIVEQEQQGKARAESLIRVADEKARLWYVREAAVDQWDYRTLKRNIASQYYYRLVQTPKGKKAVVANEAL